MPSQSQQIPYRPFAGENEVDFVGFRQEPPRSLSAKTRRKSQNRTAPGVRVRILASLSRKQTFAQLCRPRLDGRALGSEKCHVAHLAARSGFAFSVVVQKRPGKPEEAAAFRVLLDPLDFVADEIDHSSRAEQARVFGWQAADSPNLFLE